MPEHAHSRSVFAGLWSAALLYRRRTLLALGLLVLAKAAGVGVPLLLKAVVDRFSQPGALVETVSPHSTTLVVLPVFLLLSYALLRFAGTLFTELRDMVFAPVTQRTVTAYAERTFGQLLALSARFHLQRNTGSLIRDVERGTAGIGFLLGAGLFTVVPTLVEFLAVVVIMALGYSLWFTLIILITFSLYMMLTLSLTQSRALHQRRVNEMDSRANGRMVDSLINYETVKTYARENYERQRYAEMCAQWVAESVRNQRTLSRLHISQSAVIAAGVAAVMLLAGQETVRGAMTVGDLVLVNAYILQICLPLNALGFVFREARDALVNTEKLFALLALQPEIENRPGTPPLAVRGGAVRFEHVDFSYEPGRQILWDVCLTIGAGQTVAVVGGSGSGKSTLGRLLLRLYDVQGGRVCIDGQDVRSVSVESLRNAIGVVPQDTVLFNDSIAYNIGYGRIGAGMAEIIEAAKAAQVHEFIMSLPQQYDTVVGERGLKLSGGEKQRLAIARAFLKNPPIMIFDEATSALDTRAERAIQTQLDEIAQGRTTLIIAHRLSTIVNADEIVVMDKGRIVERGRHEALLAQNGLYAQLWTLQRQQQQFERMERESARQAVNLATLLANAIEGLRPLIDARQVRLYMDIDLENASVIGDPSTLSQLLREMCVWALRATPTYGRMEIKLARHQGRAHVSVTDGRHGVIESVGDGAIPTVLPAAVDRPHDIDTALDPLQLRSSIERQGGQLLVEAPGSDRGMCYIMELPLRAVAVTPPDQMAAHSALPAQQPLAGLRIMAVDDDTEARETLRVVLEDAGAQVSGFASGRDALAYLDGLPTELWPQLMVCDLALHDEDGHAVVRALRHIEARRDVALDRRLPALALTGLAQSGDRTRALLSGFQMHLAKPVDAEELISVVFTLAGGGSATPDQAQGLPP